MAKGRRTRGIMCGEPNFDECLSYLKLNPNKRNKTNIISISNSGQVHVYDNKRRDIKSWKINVVPQEAIILIPQSVINFDAFEIKDTIKSRIVSILKDDNYEVKNCEILSVVDFNCIVKYIVNIQIIGLNTISLSFDVSKYRNTDNYNDFIELLWNKVYKSLSAHNPPAMSAERIKKEFYQNEFYKNFKQRMSQKGYTIHEWDANKIYLTTNTCVCYYISSLSTADILNNIEVVHVSTHKFFKNSVLSCNFKTDANKYISKCVDVVCEEIKKTTFFCVPQKSKTHVLRKLYPDAFQKAGECSKEINEVFSNLYFGKKKDKRATEPEIYINIKNNDIKFNYGDAILTFDASNNNCTFTWSDAAKQVVQMYNKSSSLRKKIDDLFSKTQSCIRPASKGFCGIMSENSFSLIVSHRGIDKTIEINSPGISDKNLWLQKVYTPIKNAIEDLEEEFQEEQQALIEKQNSYRNTYIYWGIYSVISANQDYITATGIVHMLRGTGEKITSQMKTVPEAGQFNYYKKEEIEDCIDELCNQGILNYFYRRNDYVEYYIYKPGQPFALNSEVKYTQKELEPLFDKPHKLSDVESSSLLHYYQGRKRLYLKDYMLMLKCMSDYIIIAKAEEIGQRFAGCPDEIKSMLELMIDKEKERALKKAYKTILSAI